MFLVRREHAWRLKAAYDKRYPNEYDEISTRRTYSCSHALFPFPLEPPAALNKPMLNMSAAEPKRPRNTYMRIVCH